MPKRSPTIQYSFAAGMLDENLEARADLQSYAQGAREIRNMLTLSQGGVKTRSGLRHVCEVSGIEEGCRLARFEFSTDQTYLIIFSHLKLQILRQDEIVAELPTIWTGAELGALDWVQSLDTMILVHPDHPPQKLMRQGGHDQWDLSLVPLVNIPSYQFSDEAGAQTEPTWSENRGWPRSVYLFEGRLYFGGSRSRPQTIWGSKAGNFFDFGTTSEALDDEAVEMSLDGDRVSAIEQLYALNEFFCFSSGGIYAQSSTPISPSNFLFTRQSETPASSIRPVEMDGSLLFVSKGDDGQNKSLQELVWYDAHQIYQAQDLTIRATSLMRCPIDMAARRGDEVSSANHLFVVNKDGSCAVLHSRKSQNLTSWTLLETAGAFHRVEVVNNVPYFLVQRMEQGELSFAIEKLDTHAFLDGSHFFASEIPQKTWSGFANFEGRQFDLVGDGEPLGRKVVINGEITLDFPVSNLELGVEYGWSVETMPIEVSHIDSTLTHRRYRLTKAIIQLAKARFLSVNGKNIGGHRLDQSRMNEAVSWQKGLLTQRLLGWYGGKSGKRATVKIQGSSFHPAEILGLTVEVAS